MHEIPLYNTFEKIQPLNKGMSADKKYYIEDVDGKHFLLRVADSSEYNQKKAEYEIMKNMNSLDVNKPLLENRPQSYHHGDYHTGNMIQSKDGSLFVIDWHTVDFNNYGDPWYEFNRLGTDFPAYASGQIDGYFNNKPPEFFWRLLAYYLSASAITSIVWSKYRAPERLHSVINLNKDILYWFNDMKSVEPIWYRSEY